MDSMWFLMLGHFLGDYAFQSDRIAKIKGENLGLLALHVLVYTLTVAAVYYGGLLLSGRGIDSPTWFVFAFLGVFFVHGAQDFCKARLFSNSRQAYYIDQAIHLIQLFIIRIWLG